MSENARQNITPEKGWLFKVLSVTPRSLGNSYNNIITANTVYLGSRTLEEGVREISNSIPESDRFIEVQPFPSETIYGNPNNVLLQTKEMIRVQIEQAEKEGHGLILGFSAWGGQQILEVMELLDFTKKISNGRVVCIVGGPGLSTHSAELEADLFAAGADVINLGGGEKLARWLAQLKKDDLFERDASGNLLVELPEDAPFFLVLSKNPSYAIGSQLPGSVYYDKS